jgi:L-lactate dehydrogenase
MTLRAEYRHRPDTTVRRTQGTRPTAPEGRSTSKVAIVGAGRVGTTLAYTCLVRGLGKSIALYGRDPERLRAEALDLNHGLQFVPRTTVLGSADLEVCRGADLVVVTASAAMTPGRSRLDLAEANVAICRELVPRLVKIAPSAIFLFVANPVDVVTYAALRISGLPRSQVFGTGTVLDSSRLRQLVAAHCGVAVQNVHAYVVGEHGDSEVPLWSSAMIGGVPLAQWTPRRGPRSSGESWAAEVRSWPVRGSPTTPSASRPLTSSDRCSTTSTGCCRSAR